ncbi:DUF3828 domain-containing protein [Candidatus Viadribacter manganicus]|uniref:DUF3828 domain-containing protein n=1 Tax=Candidatus Viadribacter manganicus TaxID=1759059 RepID=A0A1B1AG56_9PROT|nr:DUF3828 domain-containing protein [Candidatus Viadribacter manganicus]ANP45540.1 hypothetical protein ATE48_06215 [Candidatus Viadribacter manganicus]
MRRRELVLALSAAALAACTPPAAENTETAGRARAVTDPAGVLRPLYDRYMTPDAQFPDFREQAPWSNSLWTLLEAMTRRSEQINEPILDFDPVIGAQDYQLSDLNVQNEAISEGSHAVVRASFNNAGARTDIVYDLIWEDDRWKVDNIRGEGWDLRQIAAAPNADAIVP